MRQSFTAVLERNVVWDGPFEVEPYEVAWASEAIYFVRVLSTDAKVEGADTLPKISASVQISPDGIHWCDEGTKVALSTEAELNF